MKVSLMGALRAALKKSRVFNHNLVNRDNWIAVQAAALPHGSRVLDVGAGSCPYRSLFQHCEYRTQDFTQLRSDQLRDGSYGRIDYVCDITAIPVEAASFDAILCAEVLEHLPDPLKAVAEFARVLRPGGRMILTAPLGSGVHQEPYHYYGGFTEFWYQKFLPELGFEQVSVTANDGSFMTFAQESVRFVRATLPGRLGMSLPAEIVWAPVWLIGALWLGVVIPLACRVLDRFDRERRFTVGYHVLARRGPA
jgi:ubiquinone/menaquinone biosynthesis C-methylase UbiE